jgi:hypothetical protein
MNVHKQEKPSICNECGRVFPWAGGMNLHKYFHKKRRIKEAAEREYMKKFPLKVSLFKNSNLIIEYKVFDDEGVEEAVANAKRKGFQIVIR